MEDLYLILDSSPKLKEFYLGMFAITIDVDNILGVFNSKDKESFINILMCYVDYREYYLALLKVICLL